jgi:hypothetical protein
VTWRSVVTLHNASIGNLHATTPGGLNVSLWGSLVGRIPCAPVLMLTAASISCALPLPPANVTADTAAVFEYRIGAAGPWQPLGMSAIVQPPPPLSGTNVPALVPQESGQRLLLTLPAARPVVGDWDATGLPPPSNALLSTAVVVVGGLHCASATFLDDRTLACAAPAGLDGSRVSVNVTLANGLRLSTAVTTPFAPPSVSAMEEAPAMVLLPPHGGLANVTVSGVGLCSRGLPRLSAVFIGGAQCGAVACIASSGMTCSGWNASAATPASTDPASGELTYNVSARWVNEEAPVTCAMCVVGVPRPIVESVSPSVVAGAGVKLFVTGSGFVEAAWMAKRSGQAAGLQLLIGGTACANVTVLSGGTVASCVTPAVPVSAPGYPLLAVVAVNAVGAASNDAVTVTYPVSLSVRWDRTDVALPLLPSDPAAGMTQAYPAGFIAPTLIVSGRDGASCVLRVNASSHACHSGAITDETGTAAVVAASRPGAITLSRAVVAQALSSTTSLPIVTSLPLTQVAVLGGFGCSAQLVAVCSDATGLVAETPAGFPVRIPAWTADWWSPRAPDGRVGTTVAASSAPALLLPGVVPPVTVNVTLAGVAALGIHAPSVAAWVSCTAVLTAPEVQPPASLELARLPARSLIGSPVSATAAAANATDSSLLVELGGIDAAQVPLNSSAVLHAECTWLPSGERLRLRPLWMRTPTGAIGDLSAGDAATTAAVDAVGQGHGAMRVSTVAAAPFNTSLPLAVVLSPPAVELGQVSTAAVPTVACQWTVQSTSSRQITLEAADVTLAPRIVVFPPPGVAQVVRYAAAAAMTLFGPPGQWLTARLECVAWPQSTTIRGPVLNFSTTAMTVVPVTPLPTWFVPSDATAPTPTVADVHVAVMFGAARLREVTCALAPVSALQAQLVPADGSAVAVFASQTPGADGAVRFPAFGLTAQFGVAGGVALRVTCARPSGDGPPPLDFIVDALPLRVELCVPPPATTTSGSPVPPFSVALAISGGDVTARATGQASALLSCNALPERLALMRSVALPPVRCSVSFTAPGSDSLGVLLVNGVAPVSANRTATWAQFSLSAPPNAAYNLTISCTASSVQVPPPLPWLVRVTGCPPGTQPDGVFCRRCGSGEFSMGTASLMTPPPPRRRQAVWPSLFRLRWLARRARRQASGALRAC